jgi:hypothetical protein
VLLERPQVVQPLGSFPAFYGIQRFITAFTRALHLYLYLDRQIQSTTLNHISKRSSLMFSIHLRLGLPSGLFPPGFLTNNLYTFFSPPFVPHVLPKHLTPTLIYTELKVSSSSLVFCFVDYLIMQSYNSTRCPMTSKRFGGSNHSLSSLSFWLLHRQTKENHVDPQPGEPVCQPGIKWKPPESKSTELPLDQQIQ